MSRNLLITGATGKQGGSVVEAVLARFSKDFTILAVTRNAQSPSAVRLTKKSSSVKLVEGNLDDVPSLFRAANKVASGPIWGVYSVQAAVAKGTTFEGEIRQGKALIDESIKNDVKYFVYSSVDRGGNERSWTNPTQIPHFKAKHQIEHHLRDSTANGKSAMGWTILRPVIFLDNITPDFQAKVFMTSLRSTMKDKPLQWIATSDIGVFAAEAFANPERFNKQAIGLAGEKLTFEELNQRFKNLTGAGVGTTVGLLGKALKAGVKEVGVMLDWFKEDGYNVDIQLAKSIHPHIKDVEAWLKRDSAFVAR
ncbi:NmrA domain-containing protein [Fusarium keratoplasticum]|uniref:NmrA domain-containing protein n=1 Tax=Fusarium keratoplasticum TaxID=1328300 RepID=A0ACC0QF09_9HYPO|nr:NmrA domain-containing protein [Fusarium keratoplasticum]KAI8652457.1 NmrA domain-containing protein [Fusarium keratoplasticum]KAI8653191.1 NmrA domain-containing protein [Fusarium keratoplasticum]